jgi:hypothetical protein
MKPLEDLGPDHCRYSMCKTTLPSTDTYPAREVMLFCAAPVTAPGKAWCARHAAVVHMVPAVGRRQAGHLEPELREKVKKWLAEVD